MSMIQFTHNLMNGPKEQIPAMNRVKQISRDANFSNRVFPMCIGYASWETDEVISEELYRNVLLAITCVFITTWILLFNFSASLQVRLMMPNKTFFNIKYQVLGCVILTLINVGGFIHFWGLTIDTVSCTNIIISIGKISLSDSRWSNANTLQVSVSTTQFTWLTPFSLILAELGMKESSSPSQK